jgi:tripartite-type tricarboxylate transporter receptor subunit TctC
MPASIPPPCPAPWRRRVAATGLVALAGLAALVAQPAAAQPGPAGWPSRPIRVIVPYPAGGVVDVMARAVAQRMAVDLGQPIVVEARPGANANIGADAVAAAPPDGYTWLVSASFLLNNPLLETGLRWKPADFVPVARYATSPSFLVVPPSSPARTVREFVDLARATPGLQYGEGGTGTPQSMSIEMLKSVAALKLEPVMYKGAPPIVPDLATGALAMAVLPSTVAIPHVKSGRLRALANTGDKRSPALPDVPTIAEAGFPDATVLSWYGFHLPAGTPEPIVRRIAAATVAATADPEVRERLASAGGEAVGQSGDAFVAFLRDEQARWTRFVEAARRNAAR